MSDNVFVARVEKSTVRQVTCAHCGTAFEYLLTRVGVGRRASNLGLEDAYSSEVATKRAKKAAQRQLAKGVDMVPCPNCFLYQPDMVSQARKKLFKPWAMVAAYLAILSPMIVMGTESAWPIAPAVIALLIGIVRALSKNPNREPEWQRREVAAQRSESSAVKELHIKRAALSAEVMQRLGEAEWIIGRLEALPRLGRKERDALDYLIRARDALLENDLMPLFRTVEEEHRVRAAVTGEKRPPRIADSKQLALKALVTVVAGGLAVGAFAVAGGFGTHVLERNLVPIPKDFFPDPPATCSCGEPATRIVKEKLDEAQSAVTGAFGRKSISVDRGEEIYFCDRHGDTAVERDDQTAPTVLFWIVLLGSFSTGQMLLRDRQRV